LDGTLIKGDLLHESALRLVFSRPSAPLLLVRWLGQGRSELKSALAENVPLNPTQLPYDEKLVSWLRQQRAMGRRLILATASDGRYARQVAEHLELFDDVLASDGHINLAGRAKLDAILAHAGGQPFSYAGNETRDLVIWRCAASAVVAGSTKSLVHRAASVTQVEGTFLRPGALAAVPKAARMHQWVKNLLIFLPFLPLAGSLPVQAWIAGLIAFLSFGLCASAVYLLNDMVDIPSDRVHHSKRHRPLASGAMSIPTGIGLAGTLVLASFTLAIALLPAHFVATLICYAILTCAYSFRLKRQVIVDVLTLAGLYTLRILAGGAALEIMPSFWMLGFSIFLFLSLASAKRMVELDELRRRGKVQTTGRGYFVPDAGLVLAQGVASGQIAVLVLALYIQSPMAGHFTRPLALWSLCPLVLFWISRLWMKVTRGELHHDPVVFALKDRWSRLVVVLCTAAVLVAL
jgi:4-hydroxybenzoate polyprenyltransferase